MGFTFTKGIFCHASDYEIDMFSIRTICKDLALQIRYLKRRQTFCKGCANSFFFHLVYCGSNDNSNYNTSYGNICIAKQERGHLDTK